MGIEKTTLTQRAPRGLTTVRCRGLSKGLPFLGDAQDGGPWGIDMMGRTAKSGAGPGCEYIQSVLVV